MSCWGSLHCGAAHGSTTPNITSSTSSSSSSSEEEEEELDEEEAEEVEEDDEEGGEGRDGLGRIGCFLGRPRRLLGGKKERIKHLFHSLCFQILFNTYYSFSQLIKHIPWTKLPGAWAQLLHQLLF